MSSSIKKKVGLFTDSILKTLSMGKFNSCINRVNHSLDAKQFNWIIIQFQFYKSNYAAAEKHVGINDLLNSSSKNEIR